ncbi:MAG TPA: ABC transporter ATP-binding protein, partial [Ktedonobacterales bacterium]|nr:ABC transporter ATP-binding protein [Ktedonobacterales bacterium]
PTTSGAALSFEGVSYAYSEREVVRSINLTVHPGEMVGLIGSNGAGKSTLLRLASGVLRPRAGSVCVGGRAISAMAPRAVAQAVAVVPQEFTVPFAYTVRQLVELGRTPYLGVLGVARRADEVAVEQALRDTSLTDLEDRVFNELSGGERQRVLVALALAQNGRLLLLDEPTAHLDLHHQVEIMDLLIRLNRERGLSLVAALHDLNLAARYLPRLVLLSQTILADGPPAMVLERGLLASAYQATTNIGILRGEQHLSILPEPHAPAEQGARAVAAGEPVVHVLSGGGSGELAMRALADLGMAFSVAPLAVGDSDAALARQLATRWTSEPPFAAVSPAGLAATRAQLRTARCALLCPAPFAAGNLPLLAAVADAAAQGLPVLLWEPDAGNAATHTAVLELAGQRDGADGRATLYYRELLDGGAAIVATAASLARALERLGLRAAQNGSSPQTAPLAERSHVG